VKAWIGVDPGKFGAMALVSDEGALVESWPGDVALAVDILRGWLCEYTVHLAALESVHARPGQGVVSMFTFGRNLGQWEGILAAFGVPYAKPTPQEWQRGLVCPSDGADTKARSLAVARRLFPGIDLHRKGDHGKADALLLATYARRRVEGT
jgi:crossover junction endodeoxyribonuclease RuvC